MEIITTPSGSKTTHGRTALYPFKDLKPGESLKIMVATFDDTQRIRSALYQFKKRHKNARIFTTETIKNHLFIHRLS